MKRQRLPQWITMSLLGVDVVADDAAIGAPAGNRSYRVLLVAPSLHRLFGGQEVQGDQLYREWLLDTDVRAELLESNAPLPPVLRSLERVRVLRAIVRAPLQLLALWRASRDVDVLHAFSGAGTSFMVATLPVIAIAKARRKGVVVHYHSALGEAHVARSLLARLALRACQRVVVPSAYLRDAFTRHGISVTVIANVVDASRFVHRQRVPSRSAILSLRNFERRYGVDDVIRAFARVKATHPDARLQLAGSGPEEDRLRELVHSLGLTDVAFVGATSREGVARLMQQATVLLNASRVDNMPVSILEAFAVGVPVVSTSAGGIPTFARDGDTALLAAVGDADRLALHVCSLLEDARLVERLTQAAHREVAKCTWSLVRPQWLALYREVLAERASSER